MSKIRVRELAKELNKTTREIIQVLKMHGIDVESHTSPLSEEKANKIRSYYSRAAAAEKTGKKPAARPARPEVRPQPARHQSQPVGGLDENGNFSMPAGGFSFDGRSDADKKMAQKRSAEKEAMKAAAEKTAAEKAAAEKPVAEKPVVEKPAAEKPVAYHPCGIEILPGAAER